MNYSFILPKNKELNNLKIKITGKDPINIVESEVNLDNIITLENGEEMSKMIVGKALKFNDELIKDEKNEIEFAKKYQILSKNTALFAEILNEKNQQSKLIKVDLNEYKKEIPSFYPTIRPYIIGSFRTMGAPRFYGAARMRSPIDFEKPRRREHEIISCKAAKKISHNNNITSSPSPQPSSNINTKVKDNITRMIMSQDIIEGYWDENEETKKLIKLITLKKFNKIREKIKNAYKGANEIKLIYTILVIYYLNEKCSKRLDEFRLIINKANRYLEQNGIKYENIISSI